ncbi:MAG: C-GCAxxG-C-C family protein [Candidatus Thorarchaeota archaeon]
MERVEEALVHFEKDGRNCSQSILTTYGSQFGLNEDLALRISGGFGGGIGRLGNVCGAVTGSVMVLSLKFRNLDPNDTENKEKTYEIVQSFIEKFIEINGSIMCRELIDSDLSTVEGREKAKTNLCPKFVRTAAEILEYYLKNVK